MKQPDSFSGFHPVVNFIFYTVILLFSMCFLHPVCLICSLVGAFCYGIVLLGKKAVRFSLRFMLPVMLLAAVLNPAFSHEGATILCYLPSGNPLTAESLYYGCAAAGMLGAVMLWFMSFHSVMSSDKIIYLFGRIIPALSLLLSMTLRFIPKFRAQMQRVTEAQSCCGRSTTTGSLWTRARNWVAVFSIMVTWSLENSIETADSMKSRGYGLSGRSAFSIYRFERRDFALMGWIAVSFAYIAVAWAKGIIAFRYYPTVKGTPLSPFAITVFFVYGLLCLTPYILNRKEKMKWQSFQSKM